MKELIEKYVVDEFGNIDIPESEEDKQKLARALLGSDLINKLDYWLNNAFDLIDNPEREKPFIREYVTSKKDRAYRAAFASLDETVKEKIKQLIADTASGIVFGSLVSFDQFDYGDLQIKLIPKNLSGYTEAVDITNTQEDLHNELPEWIENFSKYQHLLKA